MTHMHIASWIVALILLFVSYGLYSSGSAKGAKITHMILRLFYILIILTGAELFIRFANFNGEYAGKMLLGIITIGLMEMILIRKKKRNQLEACGSVLSLFSFLLFYSACICRSAFICFKS